jgi:RsmE family RNA methyltransferase
VNLILFDPDDFDRPLRPDDPRAVHIRKVLRLGEGDVFDGGVINGPRGRVRLEALNDNGLELSFQPTTPVPDPEPIILLVGLPRPQTARKILQEATALGVREIHFHLTARGDPGYARSTLWSSGETRRHLIAGTEQAFATRLPEITHGRTLEAVIAGLPDRPDRFALDNYEAPGRLIDAPLTGNAAILAVGSERGWTGKERALLRGSDFRLAGLGSRILRSETAVVAGLAILRARLGR